MRIIVNNRGMLASIGLLVTLSACSASPAPRIAVPASSQAAAAAASAAASPTPSAKTSLPAAAPSATPAERDDVQNLVISSAEIDELTAAFAAYKETSVSDLVGAGPVPGSVYYAYDPETDTYYALAYFVVSGAAPLSVQVSFQDGGRIGMFRKTGAGDWQVESAGLPGICGYLRFFPLAVLIAWSMPTSPADGSGITC